MPPEERAPQVPQLQTSPNSHSTAIALVIALASISIGGVAYAYRAPLLEILHRTQSPAGTVATESPVDTIPPAQSLTNTPTATSTHAPIDTIAKVNPMPETAGTVMPLFEYRHTARLQKATTRVPNTIRVQLYGPAKLSGYDSDGNFVTRDSILDLCKGICSGKEKLSFELLQQGVADEPLANIALENVQKEYDAYVQNGKVGMFYSSVISVSLPAKPPQSESYPYPIWSSSFIPYVFSDLNDNGVWDSEKSVGGATDYLMFVRENEKRPEFVLGWNFAYASGDQEKAAVVKFKDDPRGLQEYRKSYDSVIFQIPVLSTKELLFSTDLSNVPLQ
ncbi:MAG: hypothetical protein Q7S50_03350 [bacterium]|nr:hypothetical protein [bacterium]